MAHFYAIARGNEYEFEDEELEPLETSASSTLPSSLSSGSTSSTSHSRTVTPTAENSSRTLLSTTVQGTWIRLYQHGRIAFRRVFAPDPYMRRLNITIYSIGLLLLISSLFIPNNKNLVLSITGITLGIAISINCIRLITVCYSSLRHSNDFPTVSSVRSNPRIRSSRGPSSYLNTSSSSSSAPSVRDDPEFYENLTPHDLLNIILRDALRNNHANDTLSTEETNNTSNTGNITAATQSTENTNNHPNTDTGTTTSTTDDSSRFSTPVFLSRAQVRRLRQAGFSYEAIASFAIIAAAQRSNLTLLNNYESLLELDDLANHATISVNNRHGVHDPYTDRRPQGASLQEIYQLPSYKYHTKIMSEEKNVENIDSKLNANNDNEQDNHITIKIDSNTDNTIKIDSNTDNENIKSTATIKESSKAISSSSSSSSTDITSTTVFTPSLTTSNLHTCQICLEDYTENDNIRILPCIHSFHMDCIDKWLVQKSVCPICKSNIREYM